MPGWWLAAAAQASVVLKTGDVCVRLDPSFANALGEPGTVGTPTPGHGLAFEITDAMGTYTGFLLDESGCLDDYPVFAEENGGTVTLTVASRARLRGIDVASWTGTDPIGPKRFAGAVFTVSTGPRTEFAATVTVVSPDQRWRNLAVATTRFWDFDWDVDRPARTVRLELQVDPSAPPGSWRTRLHDTDDVLGNEPIGVGTGADLVFRRRLARAIQPVLVRLNEAHRGCRFRWNVVPGSARCR